MHSSRKWRGKDKNGRGCASASAGIASRTFGGSAACWRPEGKYLAAASTGLARHACAGITSIATPCRRHQNKRGGLNRSTKRLARRIALAGLANGAWSTSVALPCPACVSHLAARGGLRGAAGIGRHALLLTARDWANRQSGVGVCAGIAVRRLGNLFAPPGRRASSGSHIWRAAP